MCITSQIYYYPSTVYDEIPGLSGQTLDHQDERGRIVRHEKDAQLEAERWRARAVSAENKLRAEKDRAFKLRRRLIQITGMMNFMADRSEKILTETE
jgi:hypothetical protein